MIAPIPLKNNDRRADPSPEEIATHCRRIQSGWSDDEEQKRRVGRLNQRRLWEPPAAKTAETSL